MSVRWVLNRHFRAMPLERTKRRWVLDSSDDATRGSHVQIVFLCPEAAAIQGAIDIREIESRPDGDERRSFVIDGPQGALLVRAQAMHVHETPGRQYGAALPPQPVSVVQRWLWRLLLAGFRIPGIFALVARMRRRRQ
jgi:hypothetical protein